jgi:hypothetical protein
MSDHAERAAASATEAHADSDSIFVWTFGSSLAAKGELSPLAEQIEAIEAVGWRLERFSTALSPSFVKELIATCVFRRS